jgi:hypothetical protein
MQVGTGQVQKGAVRRFAACVLVAAAAAGGFVGCGGAEPAATTGTIRGVCRLAEEMERPIVRVGGGMQPCADDHSSDRIDANDARALGDCLVALEPPPPGGTWPEPMAGESRVHWIEVRRTRYVPHVSWVRVGTQIAFRSLDDCENNLHGWRDNRTTTQFNFALGKKRVDEDQEHAFLDVTGTIHMGNDGAPWMDGTLHVVAHPWHDLTSSEARSGREAGSYAFDDVPPGDYTVVSRHEGFGSTAIRAERIRHPIGYTYDPEIRLEARLTVRAGETVILDFEFPVPHRK